MESSHVTAPPLISCFPLLSLLNTTLLWKERWNRVRWNQSSKCNRRWDLCSLLKHSALCIVTEELCGRFGPFNIIFRHDALAIGVMSDLVKCKTLKSSTVMPINLCKKTTFSLHASCFLKGGCRLMLWCLSLSQCFFVKHVDWPPYWPHLWLSFLIIGSFKVLMKANTKSSLSSRCCESSSQVDVSARNLHSIESEVVVWLRF